MSLMSDVDTRVWRLPNECARLWNAVHALVWRAFHPDSRCGRAENNDCAPRTWRMADHRSWGNTIEWWKRPGPLGKGEIVGWLTPLPQTDDLLVTEMTSGKFGVYRITDVKWRRDPRDMFYATVRFEGYKETV